jgi:hypothetical protein
MRALELPMCGILLSVTLFAAAVRAADDPAGTPSVSCRVSAGQGERTYELRRTMRGSAPSWTLVMRGRDADVELPLPGAEPVIGPDTARLAYRSANGGRLVDLDVSSGGASLTVWVDHGLEVNVDPDLDPRVDEMSIERTAARCEIVPSSGATSSAPR